MRHFKNILVGVDTARGDWLVSKEFAPHTARAWRTAVSLARHNRAKLLFFSTLQVSAEVRHLIEKDQGFRPTLLDNVHERLEALLQEAKRQGVEADSKVVFGRCWIEIINQVIKGRHDLAIVGARNQGTLKSTLLGSTGAKMLRKCPCPVWITKGKPWRAPESILLVTDCTELGESAVRLAGNLAKQVSARLHILHSPEGLKSAAGREESRAEQAKRQLVNLPIVKSLSSEPLVKIVESTSFYSAILDHVKHHKNELVVVGTQTCKGIARMIRRDMAVRLLSELPCNLLALKPVYSAYPVEAEEPCPEELISPMDQGPGLPRKPGGSDTWRVS